MGRSMSSMWVALAGAALLLAAPAEARFGKKSGSSNSSSSSSSSKGSNYHSASGVGESDSDGNGGGGGQVSTPAPTGHYYQSYYYGDPYYRPWYGGHYGWGFGYRPLLFGPTYTVVEQRPPPQPEQQSPVTASLAAGATILGSSSGTGAGIDLSAAFEGERLGFNLSWSGLYIPADDGSLDTDSIKLFNGMLTYSIISRPEGRLRLEGGGMSAWAPDLIVLGPGLGVSGVLGILGPLGLDASVRMTPFPFRQIDAQAGLTIGLGPVGIRGGYRSVFLDDAGLVDGIVHTDLFAGPYVGLELVL